MKGKYPYYTVEPITDIRDMLHKSCRKYKDTVALQSKIGGAWRPLTYADLEKLVQEFSTGLIHLGMQPGDKVAILSENRSGWAVSYLAVACAGSVCVPIDKDLKDQEVFQILYLSGAKMIVTTSKSIEMIVELKKRLPQLQHVINMDTDRNIPGMTTFAEIVGRGRERIQGGNNEYLKRVVKPEDLAAIIFTSGTTGNPKGVMLTQKNIASNIMDTRRSVRIGEGDRFLSVLPLHHTYECTAGFLIPLHGGATISYCENLRRVAENLAETKTTVMLGVPLLFEAMYKKIHDAIQEKGAFKFKLAKGIAGLGEKFFGGKARRRIFKALHDRFGGQLRLLISGGAPINPAVAKGFRELGIAFIQGYGMTEAAPLIAVNRDRAFKDAAAGLPVAGVEIKIAEDGEVLARGDNIMAGYYNNPQATTETLHDGWLHTGDLGYIDRDGFLYIQGRKKSVIVLAGGKKVYPEEVEAELLKSPYILECLVWEGPESGVAADEVQAIIVPSAEYFTLQSKHGAAPTHAEIEAILREEIKKCCANLAHFKRVKKFTIRQEEFAKTTTRKVKRYLYTGRAQSVSADQK
jgi:long-chain acyl-CoA synthetase